ncbi:hypothetical protein [Streptomyces sp. NPDC051776]|uniref:hypothetical protein n=1 Tax=Streptomyces sp. NPDC051776 TaxID=3155414 RepID=UPI003417EAA5
MSDLAKPGSSGTVTPRPAGAEPSPQETGSSIFILALDGEAYANFILALDGEAYANKLAALTGSHRTPGHWRTPAA